MNKSLIYLFITVFGAIGAYLPTLIGAGGFSIWSIIGSTAGGLFGIWLAVKISKSM